MPVIININKINKNKGFTLIESVVAIGVLGIFFAVITLILQQVLGNIGESRVRATALEIGQEKMELIRNLPYLNVGTIGGIPNGPIKQNEIINANGIDYNIKTSITFIDDEFDQKLPLDPINTDYKRTRIEITWDGAYKSKYPVTYVTNIVPKGLESAEGGGTIVIQVLNAQGDPVANAKVSVINTDVIPNINTETLTDNSGYAIIPGAPACITCYKITVSKTNFSTDKTYGSNEVANPLHPHATVIEGQLTALTFSIDQVSSLTIQSYNTSYLPLGNVMFRLKGNKIIGYDTDDNPVYKYSSQHNTAGSSVSIHGLEWDTYTLDYTDSFFTLTGSNPLLPFTLNPNSSQIIATTNTPKANTSLQLTVVNSLNQLQSGAIATLSSSLIGYSQTKITAATGSADWGQTFFPSLTYGQTYNLEISQTGYQQATSSYVITTNYRDKITLNQ